MIKCSPWNMAVVSALEFVLNIERHQRFHSLRGDVFVCVSVSLSVGVCSFSRTGIFEWYLGHVIMG